MTHPSVQANEFVRTAFLNEPNLDYEAAIQSLKDSGQPYDAYSAAFDALYDVFRLMDVDIQAAIQSDVSNPNDLKKLLNRFGSGDTGYVFTLNQDLLLERSYAGIPDKMACRRPGVPRATAQQDRRAACHGPQAHSIEFGPEHTIRVDDGESSDPTVDLTGSMNYIKLHGSMDFMTARGPLMVAGTDKAKQIQEFELIGRYWEIFREVLRAGNVRVLIIGYGFADPCVNDELCNAVAEFGAKLYVWNKDLSSIRKKLCAPADNSTLKTGTTIWSGIGGFYTDTFDASFPRYGTGTARYSDFCELFFNAA